MSRVVAANQTFAIPPGNPDYHVDGAIMLNHGAEIVSLQPHMHLRGKWMGFRAYDPKSNPSDILVKVKRRLRLRT